MEDETKTLVKNQNHGQFISSQVFEMFRVKLFADCSISAGGQTVKAHRLVLAAASPYLREMLLSAALFECHPIIVLSEISFVDVCNVLAFIYTGVTTVGFEGIVHFTKIAKNLQLQGIEGFGIDLKKKDSSLSIREVGSAHSNQVIPQQGSSGSLSTPMEANSEKRVIRSKRLGALKPESSLSSVSSYESSAESSENYYTKSKRFRHTRRSAVLPGKIPCKFCPNKYNNINTLKNHQRFCLHNPNRSISRCPICKIEVKPGSMTYHKRIAHNYVPAEHKRF